jgi:SAM-dependent methyltransferase
MSLNEYINADHALKYLARADHLPHRTEGEAVLLDLLPRPTRRVLDLGCGDGRLMALARLARPEASGLALDFSPTMLAGARKRFEQDANVQVVAYNFSLALPDLGIFDAVISSFAIHHVSDERKASLYAEIFACLRPGGIFCNLEHVASPSERLHADFYQALGLSVADGDPSNQCSAVELQLGWLRQIGFADVDCLWKWREFALLVGRRPELEHGNAEYAEK